VIHESFTTLATAAHGKILRGKPDLVINGHFTDTREPVRGGLYVALRGERFDGNMFAREAVEQYGAAAVLVDREQAANELPDYVSTILVDDAREGYLGIAAVHRQRLTNCLWLGVTGSVGKSTTKEMLAHVLAISKPRRRVHKAKGSFNNAVGLAKTILETDVDVGAAVLELGTNHPGEIAQLASVARPQIAVITRAAESHLEAFETVENVAREKAAILKFQEFDDTAVLNADDQYFDLWQREAPGRVICFGLAENADVRATKIILDGSSCARFVVSYKPTGEIAVCALRVPGVHQVSNALAAIGAALAANVSLEEAAASIGTFAGIERRFTIHYAGGVTVIDDAYNANPASFSAALSTLAALRAQSRYVVAGGMLELGAQSEARHRDIGAALAQLNLSGLLVVGELAAAIGTGAQAAGMLSSRVSYCATPEDAAVALGGILRAGDAVLVKGSHGIQLERCIKPLLKKLGR
jgi:UDP-N-acetylmuramoyl-tripeptide--D-alanyl-D-alanine ligase